MLNTLGRFRDARPLLLLRCGIGRSCFRYGAPKLLGGKTWNRP
jgi:hypothetical protein